MIRTKRFFVPGQLLTDKVEASQRTLFELGSYERQVGHCVSLHLAFLWVEI